MAIEHFDEGVYASNVWFGAEYGFQYPAQYLYAPPLLPSLIEGVLLLFGPSNFGAMVPSLFAGCLTIPLVWWVGREWFGPTAGIASATLATLSDSHIVFSRTALTDVLLCFWLLLAVYFVWKALTDGGRLPTVAAGICTALAWWTKYNGWLPLAIGGAGLVPWCILPRLRIRSSLVDFGFSLSEAMPGSGSTKRGNRDPRRPESIGANARISEALVRWLAIAAIAFTVWAPWLWHLQSKGGYAAVAANHRGYLVGLTGWLSACQTQFGNLTLLEGTPGQHAPMAAFLVATIWAACGARRFTWNGLAGSFDSWLALALLAALSAVLSGWGMTACIGTIGLVTALVVVDGIAQTAVWRRMRLAVWMLAAWFVGLSLTTPIYTPYPRLTLPLVMAGWLSGGLGIYLIISFLGQVAEDRQASAIGSFDRVILRRSNNPLPRGVMLFGSLGLGVCGLFALEANFFRQGFPCWESRTTVKEEATKFLVACTRTDGDSALIYTFAEPALLFQLYLGGASDVYPIASLDFAHAASPTPDMKRFVVIGSQATRTRGYDAQFEAIADRLSLVRGDCLESSRVVWLDSRGWKPAMDELEADPESCRYRISLYRVH